MPRAFVILKLSLGRLSLSLTAQDRDWLWLYSLLAFLFGRRELLPHNASKCWERTWAEDLDKWPSTSFSRQLQPSWVQSGRAIAGRCLSWRTSLVQSWRSHLNSYFSYIRPIRQDLKCSKSLEFLFPIPAMFCNSHHLECCLLFRTSCLFSSA